MNIHMKGRIAMSQSHHHEHTHQHQHEHNHGKMPIILYIGGLVLALIALFLSEDIAPLRNSLFAIATDRKSVV